MRLAIALAFLLTALPAYTADWDVPPDSIECDDSATAALDACAAKAYDKADAELNEVWKKVLARFEPNNPSGPPSPQPVSAEQAAEWKNDLVAAQKAWNDFKDKDCNGARSYEYWGGSARGLAVTSCLYEYTVERTADLKERYLEE